MYLPESPFFQNSLAGASGLVLMSVPGHIGKVIVGRAQPVAANQCSPVGQDQIVPPGDQVARPI